VRLAAGADAADGAAAAGVGAAVLGAGAGAGDGCAVAGVNGLGCDPYVLDVG